MKVKDIMKSNPLTVREDDTLSVAQSILAWAGVRHLPVLSGGKLTGILSDRNLLSYRADRAPEGRWRDAPVRAAMQPSPQTAHSEDALTEVAGRMAMAKIGALPVVDQGKLVGIITTIDVLAGEVRDAMAPTAPAAHPSPSAGDAMTRAPLTARPTDSLLDAASAMAEHRVRHLPVVDDEGAVIGMLSEQDVRAVVGDPIDFMRARETRIDPGRLRVGEVMAHPPVTVSTDAAISELAHLFADRTVNALPVVDQGGKLVGMLSYVDALRSLARESRSGAPDR
jgi:CBS domain-containing protein